MGGGGWDPHAMMGACLKKTLLSLPVWTMLPSVHCKSFSSPLSAITRTHQAPTLVWRLLQGLPVCTAVAAVNVYSVTTANHHGCISTANMSHLTVTNQPDRAAHSPAAGGPTIGVTLHSWPHYDVAHIVCPWHSSLPRLSTHDTTTHRTADMRDADYSCLSTAP
jgi:hypothetical protein